MNDRDLAKDLRARFRDLAEEDARRAPRFEAVLGAARRRAAPAPRWRPWALVGGGLAAAAAIAVMVWSGDAGDERFEALVASYESVPGGPAWQAPTDPLLRVPGSELLGTMPSIGGGVPRAPQAPPGPRM